MLGNPEAAQALSEQMLALAQNLSERRHLIRSLNLLGMTHNIQGRYQQAAAYLEQALASCRELGDRRQEMDLLNNLGVIAQARGDNQTAFARFQEALDLAQNIGNRDGEIVFRSNLGEAHLKMGQFEAAEANLRHALDLAKSVGSEALSDTHAFLADAYLGQGKLDLAIEAGRRALAIGQEEDVPEYISAAWRVLGKIAAQLSEPLLIGSAAQPPSSYDAPACFAQSLQICAETGMEGERARTLRAWARYELERGDRGRGQEMWQEARALFEQLGADLEVARMDDLPAEITN
jgi:tetratricopeptide (TPR) repeat protein